ncbi:30S ribosomal protein S1 [Rickettsia sp. MEAM1 (Bemisia tabaci)]|uniref:30S ribosomal protein S1 n=1 Tax=unclassified Rickettsia TaxID=114295 RepID=UPI0002D30E1F|nr:MULTISPECIES: 30S ribosomal protein S1 [unclassified Rickettsia]ASX27650.1 30S ribosomal protein S1 [Rickettsia sp. MEAM1 (Bemisia tabaci)]ODA37050.1 30S ribosomal protein S1 [Rickettsia sp. wq]ODA37813.1 30S ribosomal protein S1 [Rickettsia sp. wb]
MTTKLKQRFVPQLAAVNHEFEDDFSKMLETVDMSHIKPGTVVKGQVVDINKVVVVDVGLKNEGRIPKSEFLLSPAHKLPEIGDLVDVYIEKTEGHSGKTLSREKAIKEELWGQLELMCSKGEFVDGTIFGRVKGGFTVDLSGVVAFLPGSQVDVRPIKDPSSIMNIRQPFKILSMDKKLGNIVVSRRAILEESRSEARDEMLSKIKEGMILEGTVKNITDYGAFIDLGSVDGLLHLTDISWGRVNHPSEVLEFNQKVKVMVIKFNEETKRISLGMKQLDYNPWEKIKEEFPVGKKMTGKVTNFADYGVFIELKDGLEGLVHSSEISWLKSNQNPRKTLTIGQEVEFMVLEVDTEKHRVSLSIKQCQQNPLIKFAETNPVGTVIKAPIRNITDFGIFVALSDNLDGMIHEGDITWEDNGNELLKTYKKGDKVDCKVLTINIEKEQISLGIKQLTPNPYQGIADEYKKGTVVKAVVTAIKDDGLEVLVNDKAAGFIKKSDLSDEKEEQKPEMFAVDQEIEAKVASIEKSTNKILLSIKAHKIAERQKALKEYGSSDNTTNMGDILANALEDSKK